MLFRVPFQVLATILKERRINQNRIPVFSRNGSAFQAIMKRIKLVAPTDMRMLIFGENGTGKEHITHTIYTRKAGVLVNHSWLWTMVHSPHNLHLLRSSGTLKEYSQVQIAARKDSRRRHAVFG